MSIPYFPDLRFADPAWLLLLLLLPGLALLSGRKGKAPAVSFPLASLLSDLGSPARSAFGRLFAGLLIASLAFAILALARPQKIKSYDEVKSEGIAIMLTVDVSRSMLIEDFYIGGRPVNRLVAAKRVMQDFIRGREHDRIGIVAFSGAPYLPCPLTTDREWLEKNIDRVQVGVMEDGTAIGSGIASSARRLEQQQVPSKVIILITDGANNSGKLSPQDAARLAATPGIKIYTIAIGTAGVHMFRDLNGQITSSGRQEFDEATLREVARIGGGAAYLAQDLNALSNIFKTIDQLEKSEVRKRNIVETKDLFPWPLAAAAVLLLLSLALRLSVLRSAPEPAAA